MCLAVDSVVSVIDEIPVLKIHAVDNNKVAGELRVEDWDSPFLGSVDIKEFEVRPEYRRQGVGRRMLNALVRAAKRRRNISRIFVTVKKGNVAASRAYAAAGFRVVRRNGDVEYVRPNRDYRLMVLRLQSEHKPVA